MEDCWDTDHRHGFPPRGHLDNKEKNKWPGTKWYCAGGNTSRMKTMKEVMSELLSSLKNVNVGFMTLRGVMDEPRPARNYYPYNDKNNNEYENPNDARFKPDNMTIAAWRKRNEDNNEAIDGTLMTEWRENIEFIQDIETNRNILIDKINKIKPLNQTPIVPSLYEAARYLTAIDNKHNTWEMSGNDNIPASPITEECQPTHLVLLTDGVANWSWKHVPEGVKPKKSSNDTDKNAPDRFRSLHGPKNYNASPNELEGGFSESWQNHFSKLLDTAVIDLPHLASDTPGKFIFDGKSSDFTDNNRAGKGADKLLCKMRGDWRWIPINKGWGDSGTASNWLYDEFRYAGDTDCAFELAYWMNTTDQSPNIPNKKKPNTITTHTVGFALTPLGVTEGQTAQEFLKDLAKAGGGSSYTADTKDELKEALENIVSQVLQVDSATFVNPSVPREHFKSDVENKDEVYYPLFRPGITNRWAGNLKRYRLDNSSGIVIVRDANDDEAINDDGSFKSSSKSYWSTAPDGHDIVVGGAAAKLPDADKRNLFVILEATANNTPLPKLKYDNITNPMLGIPGSGTAANNKRKEFLDYIRGFAEDGKTTRRTLGDPLHSAPALFSYCSGTISSDGQCTGTAEQMAVMGSNEGFVHMFDTRTGIEQFAVMPQALLKNIKTLKADENLNPSVGRPYGMDNTVTLWVNDDNGKVNHVYAYASMRRGGKGIYALDISDKHKPKLPWQIIGGKPGFERLGETWSQPVKAKIKISGIPRDVLIFGGGYDKNQDDFSKYQANEQKGNAIYIVDAVTREKLFEASSVSNPYLNLSAMKYSIPGKVRVVDLDNDGLADQLFFADTGGQVWRLIINNEDSSKPLITAEDGDANKKGVLAQLGDKSAHSENRRFYHEPGVAFIRGGTSPLHVNIGSGYRAHPLHIGVQDKLYSIQVPRLSRITSTLKDENLLDVSTRFDGDTITTEIRNDSHLNGWKISLPRQGEKVLSTPATYNGQLFFNTYVPGVSSNPCYPAIGNNYLYAVDLENGAPLYGTERAELSDAMGIAGDPVLIKLSGKKYMQRDAGSDSQSGSGSGSGSGNCSSYACPPDNGVGNKTYWIDVENE